MSVLYNRNKPANRASQHKQTDPNFYLIQVLSMAAGALRTMFKKPVVLSNIAIWMLQHSGTSAWIM